MKSTADQQNQSEKKKRPVPTDAQIAQAIALLRSERKLDGFDSYFNAEATSAIDILATSRSERGVLPLFDLLLKYPPQNEIQSWRRPGMIGRALIAIGEPAVVPLLQLLQTGNETVRANVIRLLGQIADERAEPFIIQALQDDQFRVRWCAVGAISGFPTQRAIPLLLDVLRNKNTDVRDAAIRVLEEEKYSDERVLVALLEAYQDPSLRERALVALCKKDDERIAPLLLDAIRDKYEWVWARKSAIEALGKRREARAIPLYFDALKEEDFYIHQSAAKALCDFGRREELVMALLASHQMSIPDKLNALEALRHTHFKFTDSILYNGKLIRDYRFPSIVRYCRKLVRMNLSPEIRQVVAELQREIKTRSEASQKEKAPPHSWLERLLGRGK